MFWFNFNLILIIHTGTLTDWPIDTIVFSISTSSFEFWNKIGISLVDIQFLIVNILSLYSPNFIVGKFISFKSISYNIEQLPIIGIVYDSPPTEWINNDVEYFPIFFGLKRIYNIFI